MLLHFCVFAFVALFCSWWHHSGESPYLHKLFFLFFLTLAVQIVSTCLCALVFLSVILCQRHQTHNKNTINNSKHTFQDHLSQKRDSWRVWIKSIGTLGLLITVVDSVSFVCARNSSHFSALFLKYYGNPNYNWLHTHYITTGYAAIHIIFWLRLMLDSWLSVKSGIIAFQSKARKLATWQPLCTHALI